MPRQVALSNVSLADLQAEIQRRLGKLEELLKQREQLDAEIADLQALVSPGPSGPAGEVVVSKRKKAKKVKRGTRGTYAQTAQDVLVDLLRGKTLTTAEIKAEWAKTGRAGRADNALTALIKSGIIARKKAPGQQGSSYRLIVGKAKAKHVAKSPVTGRKQRKRREHPVTAEQFILDLLKQKPLSTKAINEAWKAAGRGGVASPDLSKLLKGKKIKASKLGGKLGSEYSLA